MIGNDIIDLQFARRENQWQRPGYLEKIFTIEEQHYIEEAKDQDQAVWLLWSRKESVYKIVSRIKGERFFAPKQIKNLCLAHDCDLQRYSGRLEFEGHTFSTDSVVHDQFIHTTAQLIQEDRQITADCFYIEKSNYSTQHKTTQQRLLTSFAKTTHYPIQELSIRKDEHHIPHLFHNDKHLSPAISISHHGFYGSYAWQS